MARGPTQSEPTDPGLLVLFAGEAAEHIAGLRSDLVSLADPSSTTDARASLAGLRRNAHGIVGSAWAVGIAAAAELMQAVEHGCVEWARSEAIPSETQLKAVAGAVDATERVIAAAVAGQAVPTVLDVEGLVAVLVPEAPR